MQGHAEPRELLLLLGLLGLLGLRVQANGCCAAAMAAAAAAAGRVCGAEGLCAAGSAAVCGCHHAAGGETDLEGLGGRGLLLLLLLYLQD